jgi:drug/metabolite transporter (DMT)-like permease
MGLESVFWTLFGVLLYHEQLGIIQIIGMVLILAAVFAGGTERIAYNQKR